MERTEKIRKFVSEEFFYIELKIKEKVKKEESVAIFNWKRHRLFDKDFTHTIYEKVLNAKSGIVNSVLLIIITID